MSSLYNRYSEHLVRKYGKKVYKLPVNLPGTCPNRDGKAGTGGCIFCDGQGAGFDCLSNEISVKEQLARNGSFFRKRFKAELFIAYFQAFTNTYMPFEVFQTHMEAALNTENLVALSISTRPDCISDRYLDFLQNISESHGIDIDIELGLQTVNYHTLAMINRGHSLAEFIDAAMRIKSRGFSLCAHLILNLPWDNQRDVIENAKIISALQVDYVKLHSLYIVEGTVLGEMYQRGEFSMITLEEYIKRVADFLEYLSPDVVIQRLVGKGPKDRLLFSNWGASWWLIKNNIEDYLVNNEIYQGKKFDYLNGL